MKFLVCIKQVGDDGDMNRFDLHALEQALSAFQLKHILH